MKKDSRLLDEKELLDALKEENSKPTDNTSLDHTVLQFLAKLAIFPGEYKVKGVILHKLYAYHFPYDKLNRYEFHMLLKEFLPNEKSCGYVQYYINIEAKNVAVELSKMIVKKKDKRTSPGYKAIKHLDGFLRVFDLKQGQGRIPAMALYYLYDKWVFKTQYKPVLSYNRFANLIKKRFKTLKTKYFNCVLKIDRDFFKHFTEEEINTALNWAMNHNEKTYNKKTRPDKSEKQTF